MSSSEYFRRPTWIDLQHEVPEPVHEDFIEQTEFPQLAPSSEQELTPEEAYRNGLAEGEERGCAAALKELEPVIQELRALSASMTAVRQERLSAAESELIQVATEIAQRILHGELEQGSDVVLRMAHACVEEAKGEESLVLHVAPTDLELVRTHLPELELDFADGGVQVQEDPSLQPGSVVLETPVRCYDGRPERILRHAQQHLDAEEKG